MKVSNWFHGAWKGVISAFASVVAAGGLHLLFPNCSSFLCTAAGGTVLLTVWSGLAGVGIPAAPPQGGLS